LPYGAPLKELIDRAGTRGSLADWLRQSPALTRVIL